MKAYNKGSSEYILHGDFFNLCKKIFSNFEMTETYAEQIQTDVDSFYQKHRSLFALDLCVTILTEAERIFNESTLP